MVRSYGRRSGATHYEQLSAETFDTEYLYTKGRASDVVVANDNGTWRAMGENSELASGSDAGSVINSVLTTGRTVAVVDDFSTDTTINIPQGRFDDNQGCTLDVNARWTYDGTGVACYLGPNTIYSQIQFRQLRTTSNNGSVAFRHGGAEWNLIQGQIIGGEQSSEAFTDAGIQYIAASDTGDPGEPPTGGHNWWAINRIDGGGFTTSYGVDLQSNSDFNVQGSKFLISVIKACATGVRNGQSTSDRNHKYNYWRTDIDLVASGNPLFDTYGEQDEWVLTGFIIDQGTGPIFRSSADDCIFRTPREPSGATYNTNTVARQHANNHYQPVMNVEGSYKGIDSDDTYRKMLEIVGGSDQVVTYAANGASGTGAGEYYVDADTWMGVRDSSGTLHFLFSPSSNEIKLQNDGKVTFNDENGDNVNLYADGGELIAEDSAGNTTTLT